jgi:hypothetical protein
VSKEERARRYQENVARRDMPRTIALLLEYAEGPERDRAFRLMRTGVIEALEATARDDARWRARISEAFGELGIKTVSDYLDDATDEKTPAQ